METYRTKIKTLEDLKTELERIKARGKKVVFTNGCFDILHPGHIRYLWNARQLGDHLVVAVNSDRSVREIKGSSRPILGEAARSELIAALEFVDGVVVFDEEDPLNVIESLLPDVLVKGGDWSEERIIGADVVRRAGGEVRVIPFVEGFSTTTIIEKIRTGFVRAGLC
ncbi:MAG: D-glycero-beta-D-manno-heptose 1-phosphate adenylyltransferase [Deltaproteobacteria bacterium HGW-Deltaproteobacteria-15]|jgi:D-beta-D-heptose 7-phosphate kinase/D-beta-D-heptose 1-phosphate adenosyltransferase|nr:MAG: D-glycero-beta-D-manno-heptose 1-phosphate adenylyltransferase [Deltaproteobacteria bacterium HGW-Deltaproteobacteria-15]